MRLKIAGGRLYDPTCGWDGEAGDLYIEDGRLVAPLAEVDREIEARGQIVTPAGIELRGQAATYGLNFLRLINAAPSLRELGQGYALLGYTKKIDKGQEVRFPDRPGGWSRWKAAQKPTRAGLSDLSLGQNHDGQWSGPFPHFVPPGGWLHPND